MAQAFAANGAVVAFDIGVLLRFTWLDEFQLDVAFLSPVHQLSTHILVAIFGPPIS